MDTLQCAIVLAKLVGFDWEVGQRIAIGMRYNALLDGQGVSRVQQGTDRTCVVVQYTVFDDHRPEVQERLKTAGVPTAVHYPVPLNEQPSYHHLGDVYSTPNACGIAKQVMSLPMGPDLGVQEHQRITGLRVL